VFWHDAPGPTDGERERLAAVGIGLGETRVDALERVDGELTGVRLADGRVVARQAVSVSPVLHARADLLDDLGLVLTDLAVDGTVVGSYVATGATDVRGVWAAGNLADPMAQVITAASAGAAAPVAAAHAPRAVFASGTRRAGAGGARAGRRRGCGGKPGRRRARWHRRESARTPPAARVNAPRATLINAKLPPQAPARVRDLAQFVELTALPSRWRGGRPRSGQ